MNKACLDEKFLQINGHISYIEEDYNAFKLLSNKQSLEEVLIQRTVRTTIQILYDKGLINGFPNAIEVRKDQLFVKTRRGDLEEVYDVVQ